MNRMTIEEYVQEIQKRKWEAHHKKWLYIELNAKELLDELEPNVKNLSTCCKALLDQLLEGDKLLEAPKTKNHCGEALSVRYYVDNLSPQRKKYAEVNS